MGLIGANSPRDYALELFRFHIWRVKTLQEVTQQLKEDDLNQPLNGSFSSLLALMNHLCWAEMVWLDRLQNKPMPARISLDYQALIEHWNTITSAWTNYLENASESDWSQTFQFKNSKGNSYENNLLEIVVHLIDHATYHTGQIMTAVRGMGYKPISSNYIHYLRANK